jgi:hypothetical protein
MTGRDVTGAVPTVKRRAEGVALGLAVTLGLSLAVAVAVAVDPDPLRI